MKRRSMGALALFPLLPLFTHAQPNTALDAVRSRMSDAPLLRGGFVQTRRVTGFRNPLRSTGDLLVLRGKGVLWQTREPFAQTLIVTPQRLETRDARGQRVKQIDVRNEPLMRSINELLLAVVAGDLAALGRLFTIDAQLQGSNGWRLLLKPSDPLLARQLAGVVLAGERYVNEVQIEERAGSQTDVVFSGWRSGGAASADELALLAGQ